MVPSIWEVLLPPLETYASEQHDNQGIHGIKRSFKCPCGNSSISPDRLLGSTAVTVASSNGNGVECKRQRQIPRQEEKPWDQEQRNMPNFQKAFNSPDFKQLLTTYVASADSGKARVLACSVHVPDRHNQNKYLLSLKKKKPQKGHR